MPLPPCMSIVPLRLVLTTRPNRVPKKISHEIKRVECMTTAGGSLDDVWSSPFDDPEPPKPTPSTAARAVGTLEAPLVAGEIAPTPAPPPPSDPTLEQVLREIQFLRAEQARQNKAVLIVASLFVALMFMYLDKIRAQTRLMRQHDSTSRLTFQ